jgi:hypothetical protein
MDRRVYCWLMAGLGSVVALVAIAIEIARGFL